MAGISLYDVVIPTFTTGLHTFDHVLTKAEEFVKDKGLSADDIFPGARLIEDQNPLTFQVQNATKAVRVTLARLTGTEAKPFEDNEKTISDLRKRIQVALKELEAVDPTLVNARQEEIVDLPWQGKTLKLSGKNVALNQGIPNFLFHLNTGYSILRAKGVPVGKADYLGSFLT